MRTDAEIQATRSEHLFPTVTHYYRKPLHAVKASMQWIWDSEGKRYLDAIGGIVTISAGHNHPRIKERLRSWMEEDRPQHTTVFYLSEPLAELTQRLVGIAPKGLKRAFITNSGSEANELAILVARHYTGRTEIVSLQHSYHGGTTGTLSLCGQSTWKFDSAPLSGVVHAAQPSCYRCPYGASPESCALECAQDVERVIQSSTSGKLAAFIAEPIQGVGGFVVPPPQYFPRVLEIVKKYGGLFISDEVQTGVGRTGSHWFGILHSGVTPDILTMAKSLGNGAPIGALLAREELSESMRGKLHFNTFGGNPWSSTQASETLRLLEEDDVLSKCRVLGQKLLDGLLEIKRDSEIVGDVRGRGLMVGLELVKDRKTKAYAPEETLEVMEQARDLGLLVGKGGMFGNVVRVTPPMCINESDVQEIVQTLGKAIQLTERKMGYRK